MKLIEAEWERFKAASLGDQEMAPETVAAAKKMFFAGALACVACLMSGGRNGPGGAAETLKLLNSELGEFALSLLRETVERMASKAFGA